MEHPEEPDAPQREETIACAEARRLLAIFCRGRLEPEEERLFRVHLPVCSDCRQGYRETLNGLAQLGKAKRAERRDKRRAEHRRMAIRAATFKPGRRFGLRLALVPAFLICSILWLDPFTPRTGLELLVTSGEVRIGERHFDPTSGERLPLARGNWCEILPESGATLVGPEVKLHAEAETYFLVEESEPIRLRLRTGAIELRGHGLVTSSWGVLDCVDAHVRLRIRDGRLELACIDGEAAWTSPSGHLLLHAGEAIGSDDLIGAANL